MAFMFKTDPVPFSASGATSGSASGAGVMGWPVTHSRSPVIHTHWFAEHRLRGDYVLLPVQPEHLAVALRGLPALGFAGCNLTIPHKIAALSLLDRVEPLAQRIGAVNTVVVEKDGSLTGRNTDAEGFIQSLRDAQSQWRGDQGPAVVIGAGGAARAVIAGLLQNGATEVRVGHATPGFAEDGVGSHVNVGQLEAWSGATAHSKLVFVGLHHQAIYQKDTIAAELDPQMP